MRLTKHAHARFKQRQNIKNQSEMARRFALAVERGRLLARGSNKENTLCIIFNGYKYIVSCDKQTLITVIPYKKTSWDSKRCIIDRLDRKQFMEDVHSC